MFNDGLGLNLGGFRVSVFGSEKFHYRRQLFSYELYIYFHEEKKISALSYTIQFMINELGP